MRTPPSNLLLSRLAEDELRTLGPYLVPVTLAKGDVLGSAQQEVTDLYFVEAGVVCLIASLTEQENVAVAVTGREGVGGCLAVLGNPLIRHRLLVEIPGSALKVEAALLRRERPALPHAVALIERYLQVLVAEIAQSALCNRYHTGCERLARWLLRTADCAATTRLPLTHDALAQMAGGARSLITAALTELRAKNAVDTSRGAITVNRARLAAQACECYGTMTAAIKRYLAS